MGFDLYGIAATSERGEFFRNSVWWWRPLAEYVLARVEVPAREGRDWGTNSGQEVSAKTAVRIADALDQLLASGETARYAQEHAAACAALPKVQCELCAGTGKWRDQLMSGRCYACDGTGRTAAWDSHYPFSEENVRDFAQFCRESGGFRIW